MRNPLTLIVMLALVAASVPSQTATPPSDSKPEARQDPPPDFKGDGCTWWPDGDYGECCLAHDRDYYRGGKSSERKASDKRLRDCVLSKGHKYLSKLMYIGVRIGGVPWLPTPFRWGFGQKKKPKTVIRKDKKAGQ